MKKITMLLIGLLALISGGAAEAANWSHDVRIAAIEVSNVNFEGVWVSFTTPPYPGTTPCPTKNGQYVLDGGISNADKMTAIATSALVNSRTVTVYADGTCLHGYPALKGITLK
jgi:hypothetical protein